MKDQLSVIFIGGLSNGKIIYDYLNKNRYVNISLVITYSDTYQGARHTILGDLSSSEFLQNSGKKIPLRIVFMLSKIWLRI